jgi:hypothetical protein
MAWPDGHAPSIRHGHLARAPGVRGPRGANNGDHARARHLRSAANPPVSKRHARHPCRRRVPPGNARTGRPLGNRVNGCDRRPAHSSRTTISPVVPQACSFAARLRDPLWFSVCSVVKPLGPANQRRHRSYAAARARRVLAPVVSQQAFLPRRARRTTEVHGDSSSDPDPSSRGVATPTKRLRHAAPAPTCPTAPPSPSCCHE